ncbi:MAG: family 16 glycoside hydrolase, partial [Thermoleophilia bacterium]
MNKYWRAKATSLCALVLTLALIVSLIPGNIFAFQFSALVDKPVFTEIPTIPAGSLTQGLDSNTGDPLVSDNLTIPPAEVGSDIASTNASMAAYSVEFLEPDPFGTQTILDEPLFEAIDLVVLPEDILPSEESEDVGPVDDSLLPLVLLELDSEASESQLETLISGHGARLDGKVPGSDIYRIKGSFETDTAALMQQLRASGLTATTQRDLRYGPEKAVEITAGVPNVLRNNVVPILEEEQLVAPVASTGGSLVAEDSPTYPQETIIPDPSVTTVSGEAAALSTDTSTAASPADSVPESLSTDTADTTPAEPTEAPGTTADTAAVTGAAESTSPEMAIYSETQAVTEADAGVLQDASSLTVPEKTAIDQVPAEDAAPETAVTAGETQKTMPPPDAVNVPRIKAVGTADDPVEYTATAGEVGMRFEAGYSAGGDLVSVSQGDKGFALGLDGTQEATPGAASPALYYKNSLTYTDSSTGVKMKLAPVAGGLEIQLDTLSGEPLVFDLPLFGLFAQASKSEEGLVLVDADTGKQAFEIMKPRTFVDGIEAGTATMLLAYEGDALKLIIEPVAAGQDLADPKLTGSSAKSLLTSFLVRFSGNNEAIASTGTFAVAGDGSGLVPDGYLAQFTAGESKILFGPTEDAAFDTASRQLACGLFTEFSGAAGAADMRFKPLAYGIEQEIVLSSVPANGRFVLPVALEGLSLRQDFEAINVLNDKGEIIGTIEAPMMYDSRPAKEGGMASSDGLDISYMEKNGSTYLIITADEAWLSDTARVYPVFVDPTVTLRFPRNGMILPTATPTFYWANDFTPTNITLLISRHPGEWTATPVKEYWVDPYLKVVETEYDLIFYDQNVFIAKHLQGVTRYALPSANALPEGVYFWRILAEHAGGAFWSSPAQFSINTSHNASYYSELPDAVPAGALLKVPVTVRNRGTSTWNATGPDYFALSYKIDWTDSEGIARSDRNASIRSHLPYDLPPGHEVTLDAQLQIPEDITAGSVVTVEWDMVHETVCWFTDRGEQPLKLTSTAQTAWNATYSVDGKVASHIEPGSSIPLDVTVKNTGQTTWQDMKLEARFFDLSGRDMTHSAGRQTQGNVVATQSQPIVKDGSKKLLKVIISPPSSPGAYIMKLDLYEGTSYGWLSNAGVATKDFPIMVGAYGVIPGVSYVSLGGNLQMNLVSGNMVMSATDYQSSGRGPPVTIARTYNSLSDTAGTFGPGWSSILDAKLVENTDGSVTYYAPDGAIHAFTPAEIIAGYQNFVHPRGLNLTLRKKDTTGVYEIINSDNTLTYKFDSYLKLSTIEDSNENIVTFKYDDPDADIRIVDASGRYVDITLDVASRVSWVKVPSSDTRRDHSYWKYSYDSAGNLVKVEFDPAVDPEGSNTTALEIAVDYGYYADGANANRLEAVKAMYNAGDDESTTRFNYDESGRLQKIIDPRSKATDFGTTITYSTDGAYREIINADEGMTTHYLGNTTRTTRTVTELIDKESVTEFTFEDTFADLDNWMLPSTNIALGKAATASSVWNNDSNYAAGKVTDGILLNQQRTNEAGFWLPQDVIDHSNYTPEWVEVDLGSSCIINGIRFLPTHDGDNGQGFIKRSTREWRIAVSNDKSVYADIASGTAPAAIRTTSGSVALMPWVDVKTGPVLARYVRFYVESYAGWGGGLNELQVYGNPVGQEPDGWTVTGSSQAGDELLNVSVDAGIQKMLVTKDSFSDFVFEAPVRMNAGNNVSLIFRVTNTKTDQLTGTDSSFGGYLFRASGFDKDDNNDQVSVASLQKRTGNGTWTPIMESKPITLPFPLNDFVMLKVEAIGPMIKCYLGDSIDPVIEIADWSFTRGKVGFRVVGSESGTSSYGFGEVAVDDKRGVKLYGKALTTFTYDSEGNLAGQDNAFSTSLQSFDDVSVYGWEAQLTEQRWSVQTDLERLEASQPENAVMYGDDMYGPNILWAGDPMWRDYTFEATVRPLEAAAPDTFWGWGGDAGILVRSNGTPEHGYLLSLYPESSAYGTALTRIQGPASGALLYGHDPDVDTGETVRLKITVSGSSITAYKNDMDTPICSINDTLLTSGKIGLHINKARAVFDDVKVTDPFGNILKFDDFQAKGDLTSTFSYDKVTGLTSGEIITYDEQNRPRTVTDKNKKKTTVLRDEAGNVTLVSDGAGNIYFNEYDEKGNVIETTIPLQPTYNYVPNPGFVLENPEDPEGSKLIDWRWESNLPNFQLAAGTDNNGSSISHDTVGYHDDTSLKIAYSDKHSDSRYIGAYSSPLPVKPGEIYTLSAFVKTDAGEGSGNLDELVYYRRVFVRFFKDYDVESRTPGPRLLEEGPEIPGATGSDAYGWQRIHKTITVPDNAKYADVFIALGRESGACQNGTSTVWIDNVQLEEGATVPEFNYIRDARIDGLSDSDTGSWTKSTAPLCAIPEAATPTDWFNTTSGWGIDENGKMSVFYWKGRGNTNLDETFLLSPVPVTGDFKYSAKIDMVKDRDVGIVFREQVNDNGTEKGWMYFARCSGLDRNGDEPHLTIWRRHLADGIVSWRKLDKVAIPLELLPQVGADDWYTLHAQVQNGSYDHDADPNTQGVAAVNIWCWFEKDGKVSPTLAVTDYGQFGYAPLTTAGKVGFRVGSSGQVLHNHHLFDDVLVTDLAGTTLFKDDFDLVSENPVKTHDQYLSQQHNNGGTSSYWEQQLDANVIEANVNYTLSADVWTKATGNDAYKGARFHIVWQNSAGFNIKDEFSPYYQTGGNEERKAITVLPPDGAVSALINLEQKNFAGETRFDNIRFEKTVGTASYSLAGNGSFEVYVDEGMARGWTFDSNSWEQDEKEYKFGKSAARIASDVPVDTSGVQTIDVKPDTTYVLSGWIMTAGLQSNGGGGAVIHAIVGGDCITTNPLRGDNAWSLQALQFTTGPDTTSISIGVQLGFGGPSIGAAWFDGIQLVEKSAWRSTYKYDYEPDGSKGGNYVIEAVGPTGTVSSAEHDAVGKTTRSTSYERSADGAMRAINTSNTFDSAGRLTKTILPPAKVGGVPGEISATYDKSGHKLLETDVSGVMTVYSYNAAGHAEIINKPAIEILADDFSDGQGEWLYSDSQRWSVGDYDNDGIDNNIMRGDYHGGASIAWREDLTESSFSYAADVRIISTNLSVANATVGMIFRADTATGNLDRNQYYFGIYPTEKDGQNPAPKWKLFKIVNGSWSLIGSQAYNIQTGVKYRLEVRAVGNLLTLYIDGKIIAAITDGTFASGKVGLRVRNAAADFDNVRVYELSETVNAYNNMGLLDSTTTAIGGRSTQTLYTYDSLGRVLSKTKDGLETAFTYDETCRKLTVTDQRGNTVRFANSASGVSATFDQLGNITSTVISRSKDNLDVTSIIDARGNISTNKADATGIKTTVDQLGNDVDNTYSAAGSLTSRVDPGNVPYQFAYDIQGRPGFFLDPLGNRLSFGYDSMGRLSDRVDARGYGQQMAYDDLGRVTEKAVSPDQGEAYAFSYGWDVAGRMTEATRTEGNVSTHISYKYDSLGKLTGASYKVNNGALRNSSYGYDLAAMGRLSEVTDISDGTVSYAYNDQGFLVGLDSSYFAPSTRMTLSYDENLKITQNLMEKRLPDGTIERYTYDARNRLTSAIIEKDGLVLHDEHYEYDANDNRTTDFQNIFVEDMSHGQGEWLYSDSQRWSVGDYDIDGIDNNILRGDFHGNNRGDFSVAWRDDLAGSRFSYAADVRIISTNLSFADATVGMIFRSDTESQNLNGNQYYFGIYPTEKEGQNPAPKWKLYKTVNGSWSLIGSQAFNIQTGVKYRLEVRAIGNLLTLYIDGNRIAEIPDATLAGGKVGVRVQNASADFDNVRLAWDRTDYKYDSANQLIKVSKLDGSEAVYVYDANGNRTVVDSREVDHFESADTAGWSQKGTGSWGVENGELSMTSGSDQSLIQSDATYAYSDISAKVNMITGNDIGIAVRVQDESNMYLVRSSGFDTAGNNESQLTIWRRKGGSWHRLATKTVASAQAVSNQWYTLRAIADGSRITAQYTYAGVTTTLSVDDTSFASGRVGFRTYGAAVNGHYHVDGVAVVGRTAYTYDKANQLTRITDASGSTGGFRYDDNGNTLFDAASHSTYSYNEINRLTSAESLLHGALSYSYDALGRLAARGSGGSVTFSDDFSGTIEGWIPYDTQWSKVDVSGNPAYQGVSSGTATVSWRGDETGDVSAAVKVRIDSTTENSGTAGLVLRSAVQPGGLDKNQYYFGIYPSEDKWMLWRTGATGAFTLISHGLYTINTNQYYTLTATARIVNGQTIMQLRIIDGDNIALVYSAPVEGPYTGKAGLRVRAATAVFDDFSLESLSPAVKTSRYVYNEVTGALMHELDALGNIIATYVSDDKGDPVSVTRFYKDANQQPASKTYYYHYNVHGDVIAMTGEDGQKVATFSYDAWGVPTEYDAAGAIVEIGAWTTATDGTPGDSLYFLFGGML